jgi:hypothetical protein
MRESRLRPLATVLGFLLAAALVSTARCDEPRLSISGYDPVAYFTDGRPVQGSPEFEYIWHKLRWRFATGEHRALFVKDREHYTPQYDGYCAMGTSNEAAAHKDTVDPEAWAIVDGKLYLAHNSYWIQKWRENAEEHIQLADASWPAVAALPSSDHPAPPRRRPRSSRCVMAGMGSLSPARSHATGSGTSSARATCGRRLSRSARTWAPASRRAGRASRTLLARSATSRTWPNSASTLIYASAISGRRLG